MFFTCKTFAVCLHDYLEHRTKAIHAQKAGTILGCSTLQSMKSETGPRFEFYSGCHKIGHYSTNVEAIKIWSILNGKAYFYLESFFNIS